MASAGQYRVAHEALMVVTPQKEGTAMPDLDRQTTADYRDGCLGSAHTDGDALHCRITN
ncbi:hypothetical protein [Mycobacterium sp.]|uniref:hypothetical protein n=1 Tax=Mycobacterium sp. TaxID=1785 RepID=UPI002D764D89|nr:hypothetical protein [Mycobacterium sp.]